MTKAKTKIEQVEEQKNETQGDVVTKKSTELIRIKRINDLPVLLPDMNKKELFNLIQESSPLADLVGEEFKIVGIIPEMVEVPEDNENPFSDMVERLRVTLVTDIGVYHSFSVTFNNALAKALNVFGAEYTSNTYTVNQKMRNMKAYYIVKVI